MKRSLLKFRITHNMNKYSSRKYLRKPGVIWRLLRKTQSTYGVKTSNYMARISQLEDFILGVGDWEYGNMGI